MNLFLNKPPIVYFYHKYNIVINHFTIKIHFFFNSGNNIFVFNHSKNNILWEETEYHKRCYLSLQKDVIDFANKKHKEHIKLSAFS